MIVSEVVPSRANIMRQYFILPPIPRTPLSFGKVLNTLCPRPVSWLFMTLFIFFCSVKTLERRTPDGSVQSSLGEGVRYFFFLFVCVHFDLLSIFVYCILNFLAPSFISFSFTFLKIAWANLVRFASVFLNLSLASWLRGGPHLRVGELGWGGVMWGGDGDGGVERRG